MWAIFLLACARAVRRLPRLHFCIDRRVRAKKRVQALWRFSPLPSNPLASSRSSSVVRCFQLPCFIVTCFMVSCLLMLVCAMPYLLVCRNSRGTRICCSMRVTTSGVCRRGKAHAGFVSRIRLWARQSHLAGGKEDRFGFHLRGLESGVRVCGGVHPFISETV